MTETEVGWLVIVDVDGAVDVDTSEVLRAAEAVHLSHSATILAKMIIHRLSGTNKRLSFCY